MLYNFPYTSLYKNTTYLINNTLHPNPSKANLLIQATSLFPCHLSHNDNEHLSCSHPINTPHLHTHPLLFIFFLFLLKCEAFSHGFLLQKMAELHTTLSLSFFNFFACFFFKTVYFSFLYNFSFNHFFIF